MSTDLGTELEKIYLYWCIDAKMSDLMESGVAYFSCYHLLGLLNNIEDTSGPYCFLFSFCFHHFKILNNTI